LLLSSFCIFCLLMFYCLGFYGLFLMKGPLGLCSRVHPIIPAKAAIKSTTIKSHWIVVIKFYISMFSSMLFLPFFCFYIYFSFFNLTFLFFNHRWQGLIQKGKDATVLLYACFKDFRKENI
ncbi:MAG: hypothetical protein QW594_01425, partial [Candidatus Woesearchaeota archaeon]